MRTLADHHRDCTLLTRKAASEAMGGAKTVALTVGDHVLSIEFCGGETVPPESRGLILYWSFYFEINRLLRERMPIDG